MKVICIYQPGNLDNKEGRTFDINKIYITRVLRAGTNNMVISKDNHLFSQNQIQQLLEIGDELEDNYSHGWYRVIP